MNKAYLYLYRRGAGSSIRSRARPIERTAHVEAGWCWSEPPKRLLKIFINVIFHFNFFSAARMSVCAAAPPPCLPLEKSANLSISRRNVESIKRSSRFRYVSSIRRNDGKAFRRQNVSAAKRFGGNVFRRFVCTLWPKRGNYSVRRAIRRIGVLP